MQVMNLENRLLFGKVHQHGFRFPNMLPNCWTVNVKT